jgi:hypothetical protein
MSVPECSRRSLSEGKRTSIGRQDRSVRSRMMLLSNRCSGVKYIIYAEETLPGAWLSSRSTLAAA